MHQTSVRRNAFALLALFMPFASSAPARACDDDTNCLGSLSSPDCDLCLDSIGCTVAVAGGCCCDQWINPWTKEYHCKDRGNCWTPPDTICLDCHLTLPYAQSAPPVWNVDFNNDGLLDHAFGVPFAGTGGTVQIHYGSEVDPYDWNAPDETWDRDSSGILDSASSNDRFGTALAAADFNGDGYDDLAIGVPWDDFGSVANAGSVHILYGSGSGLTDSGDQVFSQDTTAVEGVAEEDDAFGESLAVGDLNCDGYADLVVGVPNEALGSAAAAGAVNVLYGSSGGLSASGDQAWSQDSSGILGASEADDYFGLYVAVGDFDGAGCDDLAIAAPYEAIGAESDAGSVNVILGTSGTGLTSSSNALWHQDVSNVEGTAEEYDGWGTRLHAVDLDGDDYDDLVFYVPGESTRAELYGSSGGISASDDALASSLIAPQGFLHVPCFTDNDALKTCVCPEEFFSGNCGWFSLLCDAADATASTTPSGDAACTFGSYVEPP
jgi:hypothetical protein